MHRILAAFWQIHVVFLNEYVVSFRDVDNSQLAIQIALHSPLRRFGFAIHAGGYMLSSGLLVVNTG